MIHEAQSQLAFDIARYVAGVEVGVYDHRPGTAAAPCVYVTLSSVTFRDGTWRVELAATAVADAAEAPGSWVLADLTDRVIAAATGHPRDQTTVRASPTTVQLGEVPYPAVVVTVAQLFTSCDLPAPLTAPAGASTNGGS